MALPSAFTLVELAYVAVVTVLVVREKRHPLSTVSWVLALSLVPIAGLAIWWAIGPRRLRKQKLKRATLKHRIRASMPDLRELFEAGRGLHDEVDAFERQLITLALNNSASPVSSANDVRVLRNGFECYAALEEAIAAARHHVHLEYYTFEDDDAGRRFRDLLVRKAREGVRVRLLVDAVGSLALGPAFTAPLVDAGAEFAVFNPVRLPQLRPPNYRNHRKIVVVDAALGFTGGLNVGDAYLGRGEAGAWRDTHVRLEGPSVRALQQLFLEDWQFATGRTVKEAEYYRSSPAPGGRTLVQVVGSSPDQDWPAIQQVMHHAIAGARRRISICTPYFVPDEVTLAALVTAALRGVDVTILLPRRTDARVVRAASRSYYDELLRAGVRVFEYLPGFLHAKGVVVDGTFAIAGSANFDQRSFRINLEVMTLLYGDATALELETIFEQDLTVAREVTTEDREALRSHERLAEAFARVLSPLL